MFKIGIPIAGILLTGYFLFPQFRSAIAGLAPFALFALCPLAMLFGMKGMMGKNGHDKHHCTSCSHTAKHEIQKSM